MELEAAVASIRHLKRSGAERERHQERVRTLKEMLRAAGLAVMENTSHIVPLSRPLKKHLGIAKSIAA